jgi:hypothetical protein
MDSCEPSSTFHKLLCVRHLCDLLAIHLLLVLTLRAMFIGKVGEFVQFSMEVF